MRLSFTGTQRGAWRGVAPTGRPIAVTQMMFFRVAGGKIVEVWEDYDEYGMRQQLGDARSAPRRTSSSPAALALDPQRREQELRFHLGASIP